MYYLASLLHNCNLLAIPFCLESAQEKFFLVGGISILFSKLSKLVLGSSTDFSHGKVSLHIVRALTEAICGHSKCIECNIAK